jgi:hypothetical protein
MTYPEARAHATRLLKKFEKLLRRLIDENPGADEARLELLFIDAVTADPILGAAVSQEGFWTTVDSIRRREQGRRR